MVRACAIGESGWFYVHKFVGEHTCGVDHVTGKHRTVTVEVIASLILNFFIDNKGPSPKEIERIIFRELYCRLSFWKYWMAGVIAKNIVQGLFNTLWGYAHMRKVVTVDGSHLFGKYEGVLLSVVAQDTQNYIYPLAYCVVDKENDASWGFFFEKLKAFVIDEPDLCVIFNKHISIANGLSRHYPLAHHGVCMRYLGKNLKINHHCSDSLYLYYHAAKVYTLEEFNDYFNALKERFPSTADCL
ncbi:uncharacterized protein LOC124888837 [Capsicum annuum]|uniref:uncharacterized protein LOC124888837 n=1 Tax=Capsicum annuum TaxID=4072 RepID=UPI001FB129C1|nr:uncharacterized protein LOC124888837 [Capsicum annuum]